MRPSAARLLALPLLFACALAPAHAVAVQDATPVEAAAALPTGAEILKRFASVCGAHALVEKTSSISQFGKIKLETMNIEGTMERHGTKPSTLFLKMDVGAAGVTQIGYDGRVAWMHQPMLGYQVFDGVELFTTAMQAGYGAEFLPVEDYEKLEVQGKETFHEHTCYKVLLVYKAPADPALAKETEKVRTSTGWFDVDTGLLIGQSGTQASQGTEVAVTSIYSDYKAFGETTFATRMTQEVMSMKVVLTLDRVEYDKVDPKVFELPAAVRALLAEPEPVPEGAAR